MCIVLNKKVCTYLFNLSVLKQLDKSREFWHLPPPQNIVNIFSFRKACCWYQDTVSSNKETTWLPFIWSQGSKIIHHTLTKCAQPCCHCALVSCLHHFTTAWARWLQGENCHSAAENILGVMTQPCTGAALSSLLTLGFFRLERKLSRSREALPLFSHITWHVKQVSLNLELIHYFATIFFYISPAYRKISSGISF